MQRSEQRSGISMPYLLYREEEGVVGCAGRERVAFVPLRGCFTEESDPMTIDLLLATPMEVHLYLKDDV